MKRLILMMGIMVILVPISTTSYAQASREAELIQKLLEEVEKLKKQATPSGAVVAFDLPGGCPNGWTSFEPAVGRTVIGSMPEKQAVSNRDMNGAALAAKGYRQTGGAERHKITYNELPPLTFNFDLAVAGLGNDRYNAGGRDYRVVGVQTMKISTNTVGEGVDFSTISPFVAIHYCKKD